MKDAWWFTKCMHFDSPRCPHNDEEVVRRVVIYMMPGSKYCDPFEGYEEASAICEKCDIFRE